jgi:hypothetical protein
VKNNNKEYFNKKLDAKQSQSKAQKTVTTTTKPQKQSKAKQALSLSLSLSRVFVSCLLACLLDCCYIASLLVDCSPSTLTN